MAAPCADITCDRAAIRDRDGQRWCMYHPTATPPAMDLLSGQLRDTTHLTPLKPSAASAPVAAAQPDRPAYRAPGRVVSRTAGDPRAPEAVRLYQSGETMLAVAAQLHINPTRLRTMLVESGVTIRKRGEVVARNTPPAPTQDDVDDLPVVQGEVSRQAAAHEAHDGADSHDVGPAGNETESDPEEGDRGEQPVPVAPEPADEPSGMDILRAALATPPPVPIGGGTRCLLEKGDAHRDPSVRQAAKAARRAIDVLVAALQHADLRARRQAGSSR